MSRATLRKKIDFLLSKEKGTVYKDPGGKVNVCLVYPNTYHIGMSNLGFQGIYTLLNERADVVCERAFLPDDEDIGEYRRTGTAVFSLESKRPLNRFHIVAFSVSFENDYPHIAAILEMSKIPLRADERGTKDPLLIMGGACASFNPEPTADFFDVCFIGDAEDPLPEFIEAYKRSGSREDLFTRATATEGVYVPRFYEILYSPDGKIAGRKSRGNAPETVRRAVKDISLQPLRPSVTTPETEFSDMHLVEVMRGCPWSCRFCVTGYASNPARRKSLDVLREEVLGALGKTSRVGLIGPSLTDYPHIEDVLCMDGVDFSITSLRASPRSAELVTFLKGYRSVSIAPEAGTERLRRVVQKKITEEEIIETSRRILGEGVENLRLYFMVGLPTEEEEDIDGIVSLVQTIRNLSGKGNIVLTVSTFVPKPFTPFQWHPMERMEIVKGRLKSIKKALIPMRGVKVFHDVPKYAYMQGLFSRGDRRLSGVLAQMARGSDWQTACRDLEIDVESSLFGERGFSDSLPWDFIDIGIPREKLWSEYRKALGKEERGSLRS